MNDTWEIVYNYFRNTKNYLTNHHLDSFNNFIEEKIPQTFQQYNPQYIYKEFSKELNDYKYTTKIYYGGINGDEIFISKPVGFKEDKISQLYPNEARLRNLSYASSIFCNVYVEYTIKSSEDAEPDVFTKTFEKVNLGKIPVMLQSHLCVTNGTTPELLKQMGECPYDQGGYFIIEGAEKVIVSHERKAENKLYIVKSIDDMYSFSAQIKSVPNDTFKYARTTAININATTDKITIRLPMIHSKIPLFVMFRLLGIRSDKEIIEHILYNLDSKKAELFMEHLRPSLEDSVYVKDQITAIKYLTQLTQGKTTSHLLDNISTDLFPHIGDNFTHKAFYLGYVVNKLLEVKLGIRDPTDRDSFEFKRVDLSGFLLANLFRESFKQLQRDIRIAIDSEYRFNSSEYQNNKFANIINSANYNKIFNYNVITDAFNKSFKIGTILNKKGLIQSMNRLSWPGTMSHLRRINTLGDMIMMGQRKLHSTQYGMICPAETPDGGNIGIKKHMSTMCQITFGCSPKPIIDMLEDLGVIPLEYLTPSYIFNKVKVFVNGKWVGVHVKPLELFDTLQTYKRNSLINIFTSISFDYQNFEIQILTDGGRLCRPVAIVEDNKSLISSDHIKKAKEDKIQWESLVSGNTNTDFNKYDCKYKKPKENMETLKKNRGVIEYLDVDEINGTMLANEPSDLSNENVNYTHIELHPSLILGTLGFTLPYCNSSQAPRNVYGTGQTKQSVGMYASNFRNRMDGTSNVLSYPQKPLVSTKLSDYVFSNQLPTGMNAIVAVGCYSGYNQEDSIIINKTSIERGLFNGFTFKTFEAEERYDTKDNVEHIIGKNPDESKLKKEYNYSQINNDGVVEEGTFVNGSDILISKYIKNDDETFDDSVGLKADVDGVVDKVFIDYMNTHKHRICKVRISNKRNPALGDKFASRHGQKGTIGMVLRQEDMPFTKDGICPDLIVNPHAFPSRMTLGQFIEVIQGKVCCDMGFFADSTPFNHIYSEDVSEMLEKKCGFAKHGDEVLYGGIFGNQLETKLFIGPTYYQRLKHMVKDKVNSRNTGKYTLKNKQPPSGRSAGGGLRIGEMERDAILSHGMMGFLKESMFERSDKYEYHISDTSGMIAIANRDQNRFIDPSASGPLEFDRDLNLLNYNSQNAQVVPIRVPYNTKMLTQECEAMGICMRLIPREDASYKPMEMGEKTFEPQFTKKESHKSKTKRVTYDKIQVPIIKQSGIVTDEYYKKQLMTPLTEFELNKFITKLKDANETSKEQLRSEKKLIVTKLENNQYLVSEEVNPSFETVSVNLVENYGELLVGDKVDASSLLETQYPSHNFSYYDYEPKSPEYVPESPEYRPTSPSEPVSTFEYNSPVYKPDATFEPRSPSYEPQSPPYEPQSPPYEPQSPPSFGYNSPVYVPDSAPSFSPVVPERPLSPVPQEKAIINLLPSPEEKPLFIPSEPTNIKLDDEDITITPDYAPVSPEYHPDGTFGPEPPGERTKGYETTDDGNTRIFKLDLPETMPSIDDLETKSEPIKSDFDMALEDAELDFDTLDDI